MGTRRTAVRLDRRTGRHLVVTVGLAGFVLALYVVVVLGGGLIVGRTDSPSLPLSVLATAGVALLFAPVQSALERFADRAGYPAAATPYEVLMRFSGAVTGGHARAELPERMSMVLAQGTGAQWAQVWLNVSDRLTLAATWPADAEADDRPPSPQPEVDTRSTGRRTRAVRHGGQLLGVLRLQERPGSTLTAVEEKLFAGLADQAGLMLRLVALGAELEDRHDELAAREAELKASRERLIATQDAERRRLERDLHDGAQQHLVALAVNLRLAQTVADRSPERAARLIAAQADAAVVAIETLSSLSRGIYPRLLANEGLVPALRLAAATSAVSVTIGTTTVGRFPAPVEAALYFSCTEAVQNAAKHSGARSVSVHVAEHHGRAELTVTDDGVGFDRADVVRSGGGAGLANMRDRLDAVGGTLAVDSRPGEGTTVVAVVPLASAREPGHRRLAAPSLVG